MAIKVRDLSYTYSKGSPYEKKALDGISLEIHEGDFFCLIGHTGSGKSTFLQHLNGLIKLTEGKLSVFDIDLSARKPDYKRLRFTVGMVFQYPEYQLFDDTVEKDVGFGPRNMKLDKNEIAERVKDAINAVGLPYEEIKDKSPFEISGGQKRRSAIAGVIAMRPKVLVLDEPTAGLDPKGKEEILKLISKLKEEICPTVIMVTHDMEIVAQKATRVGVLKNGKLIADTTPEVLFARKDLEELGLERPVSVRVGQYLNELGFNISVNAITPEKLVAEIEGGLK